MAAEPFSTTRRALLGAAAALPIATVPIPVIASAPARGARQSSPAHAFWNRRLGRYRRLRARWQAEAETGAYRAANDEYESVREAMIDRFGSWEKARRSRAGKPLCAAAFARVSAAENAYYDAFTAPMQRAAARLVRTLAPDLSALLAKLDIVLKHEIDDWEGTAPYPWEELRQDLDRLAGTERETPPTG